MVKACSGHQFGLCRWFTYRTIFPPTMCIYIYVCIPSVQPLTNRDHSLGELLKCTYYVWPQMNRDCSLDSNTNSIDELIQQFEIHGPTSRLGDIRLVHHFEQVLNSHLRENIYVMVWPPFMFPLSSLSPFVCTPPHLHHLLTPSDLVHLPSTASAPTPRCTCATVLHLHSDQPRTNIGPTRTWSPHQGVPSIYFL